MESASSSVAAAVIGSIRDGSFPSGEDTLTSNVSQEAVSEILDAIRLARDDLSEQIRQASRGEAATVDDWIAQAKQVQEEIAKCKLMAREIVQEHEAGRGFEASAVDARAKTDLLSKELHFSTALQQELEAVDSINTVLGRLEEDMAGARFVQAASDLGSLHITLNQRRPSRVNAIFEDRQKRLASKCHLRLHELLLERLMFRRDASNSSVEILTGTDQASGLDTNSLLDAFDQLGTLETVTDAIKDRLDAYVVRSLLVYKSKACVSVEADEGKIELQMGEEQQPAGIVLDHTEIVFRYLHTYIPQALKPPIIAQIVPDIVAEIIKNHLDESVPFELDEIQTLGKLQRQVQRLVDLLRSLNWPFYPPLVRWIDRAPQLWLSKRKERALQGVRAIFRRRRGPDRKVERTETEKIARQDVAGESERAAETRQPYHHSRGTPAEDDSSGWGFDEEAEDDEEKPMKLNGTNNTGDQDAEAAWGWDDEEDTPLPASVGKSERTVQIGNGSLQHHGSEQELSLVETYTITDIPDHLLEIIGRDIADAELVKAPEYSILASISPSHGLLSLPTLVLTMFRATAPAYYSDTLTSGNMHLYNDTIYIVQKVRETNPSHKNNDLEMECRTMEKYAKSAYAKEMDTQRTILRDLLDGAQGFVNCTQPPHSNESENAVAAVIDRIRAVHESWKPVLSSFTLMQAVGSLLSTIIGQIIRDVEDMDDISEPQSQRLSSWFGRIKSLEDIFVAPHLDASGTAGVSGEGDENVPQTVMYCPNWLKFNYLVDILDSSLEDIKFLWTNGMLGFEYDRDEVIDLVKALFSDSIHRRNFVTEIRRLEPGSQFHQ